MSRSPNWPSIRAAVRLRDRWRCVRCGRRGRLEVHHVRPIHAGGSDDLSNLETLCRGCHIEHHRPREGPRLARWTAAVRDLM